MTAARSPGRHRGKLRLPSRDPRLPAAVPCGRSCRSCARFDSSHAPGWFPRGGAGPGSLSRHGLPRHGRLLSSALLIGVASFRRLHLQPPDDITVRKAKRAGCPARPTPMSACLVASAGNSHHAFWKSRCQSTDVGTRLPATRSNTRSRSCRPFAPYTVLCSSKFAPGNIGTGLIVV